MVEPIYSPSTPELETVRSKVQGHPGLHSELTSSLSYMKPYLKSGDTGAYIARMILTGS